MTIRKFKIANWLHQLRYWSVVPLLVSCLTGVIWAVRTQVSQDERMGRIDASIARQQFVIDRNEQRARDLEGRINDMNTPLGYYVRKFEADAKEARQDLATRLERTTKNQENDSYTIMTHANLIENLSQRVLALDDRIRNWSLIEDRIARLEKAEENHHNRKYPQ